MKPDKVTESLDYVFRMRRNGQIDEEEAQLVLDAIFSGEMDDNDFELLKMVYLIRSKGGPDKDGEDTIGSSPNASGITITIRVG